MKAKWSDKIKIRYTVYLEPVLITAAQHCGKRAGLPLTGSKFIRSAVIEKLLREKYPLKEIAPAIKINELSLRMTPCG